MRFTATPITGTSTSPSTASTQRRRRSSPSTTASTSRSPTARSLASSSGRGGNARRVVSTPWARMVASTGSGLGSRANGSRLTGPATSRSARANAVPSGLRSRKQRRSSGRREAGASYTTALAAQGMRYEKKGSGALLWIGEQPVKASTAGRDCSMAALREPAGRLRAGVSATEPARPFPREPSTNRRPHCASTSTNDASTTTNARPDGREQPVSSGGNGAISPTATGRSGPTSSAGHGGARATS